MSLDSAAERRRRNGPLHPVIEHKSSPTKNRNRSESSNDIFDVFAKSSILNATLENENGKREKSADGCADSVEECREEESGSDEEEQPKSNHVVKN